MWLHKALSGQLHGEGHQGMGEEYKDGNDPGKDARPQNRNRYNVRDFLQCYVIRVAINEIIFISKRPASAVLNLIYC